MLDLDGTIRLRRSTQMFRAEPVLRTPSTPSPCEEAAALAMCGLAIGYADLDFSANHLRISHDVISEHIVFME
jgi:hypothetical protein